MPEPKAAETKQNSHLLRKIRVVQHHHPRRTKVTTEIDYGDVVEVSELTTSQKPLETTYQKNNAINPEKVSYGYIGQLEVFSYKNSVDSFIIGANGVSYRVPIDCWRSLFRVGCRIGNVNGLNYRKKVKSNESR